MTDITVAITTMGAGVAGIWFWAKRQFDKEEEDRTNLWRVVAKLRQNLAVVAHCPTQGCQMKTLADDALDEADQDLDPQALRCSVMREMKIHTHAPADPVYSTPMRPLTEQ